MHRQIAGHRRLTDTELWSVLSVADQHPADHASVLTLYWDGPRPLGDHTEQGWWREHVWPVSRGLDTQGSCNDPLTDAHHIFAERPDYNEARSNVPYGECGPDCTDYLTSNGAYRNRLESPGEGGESSTQGRWEVWPGRRGDVARALFYMDVRYEGRATGPDGCQEMDLVLTRDVPALPPNTGFTAYMGDLCTLLEWHVQDPVSATELRRNQIVAASQHNRNPFVDDPSLVRQIWPGCRPVFVPAVESP